VFPPFEIKSVQTAVFTWVLKLTPAVYWAYIRSTLAELNCSAAFLPEGSVEHSAGGPPGLRGITARSALAAMQMLVFCRSGVSQVEWQTPMGADRRRHQHIPFGFIDLHQRFLRE
jgi:hypothetical protein